MKTYTFDLDCLTFNRAGRVEAPPKPVWIGAPLCILEEPQTGVTIGFGGPMDLYTFFELIAARSGRKLDVDTLVQRFFASPRQRKAA